VRTSYRFLIGAGIFGLVAGSIYWFITYEAAGTSLLMLMGIAPIIIGGYLVRHARHRTPPEDDPEADHAKVAGEPVGRFSAGSIWPLIMGIGCAIGVEGFVYGSWLLLTGMVLFASATVGLMMESRG